jgi:predicted dehydrogenase
MDELNWGVLGTGMVVRRAMLPALLRLPGARVLAVASSSAARAAECAAIFGLPRAYGSYQALLDDPEIACVYVALPNHLHAEWTIRAARAGKHVLCEKPLAATVREVEAMAAACAPAGVQLMEALMYRFHPRTVRVQQLLASGVIGAVRRVKAAFTFPLGARENYRLRPECGGGALLDVGGYCVSAARAALGAEPEAVRACAVYGATGIDESLVGLLMLPGGRGAGVRCSFRMGEHQRMVVYGAEGMLELPLAFTAWQGDAAPILLSRGGRQELEEVAPANPYQLMAEDFATAVRHGGPVPYPLEETRATIRVLEALALSARRGESQVLSPVDATTGESSARSC